MSGATLPTRGRILLNRVTWHLPSITITTTTRMSTKSRRCLSHAPRPPEVRAVLWGAIMERREGKRLAHICSFHQEISLSYFPGCRPCGIQRNWKPHVWNGEQGLTNSNAFTITKTLDLGWGGFQPRAARGLEGEPGVPSVRQNISSAHHAMQERPCHFQSMQVINCFKDVSGSNELYMYMYNSRIKVQSCPMCREIDIDIRNLFAEKVSSP